MQIKKGRKKLKKKRPEPPPSFSVIPLKPPTDTVMTAFIVYYYSHCPPPVITSPALLTIKYSVILFSSHTTLIHSSLLLSSNIITMKHLFPTLLLLSLLLHSCFSQPTTDGAGELLFFLGFCSLGHSFLWYKISKWSCCGLVGGGCELGFCGLKCSKRCSKAAVLDRCMKYCGICCQECKCVPSGTYGNKHECPCYRDKKNSKGKPKCPWLHHRLYMC